MKILAFLQNQWSRDPARVAAMIDRRGEDFRRRHLAASLFGGCRTGRRLQKAFGAELCRRIVWENASRQIASRPDGRFPADVDHMLARIRAERPDVVLAFGHIAEEGLFAAIGRLGGFAACPFHFIGGPHPASRRPRTAAYLADMARILGRIQAGRPTWTPSPAGEWIPAEASG